LRLGALLHFSVRGTPTMYYGEELGLNDGDIPRESLMDPSGRDNPRYGRDPMRVPMPWDDGSNGGFSKGRPWLPIDKDTLSKNVAAQQKDPHSLLNFYRKLLRLRKQEELLRTGEYTPLDAPEDVLAYRRHSQLDEFNTGLLVAFNFASHAVNWPMPQTLPRVLLSSLHEGERCVRETLHLEPGEGVVVRLERDS
jgi:alpha-glucosidase